MQPKAPPILPQFRYHHWLIITHTHRLHHPPTGSTSHVGMPHAYRPTNEPIKITLNTPSHCEAVHAAHPAATVVSLVSTKETRLINTNCTISPLKPMTRATLTVSRSSLCLMRRGKYGKTSDYTKKSQVLCWLCALKARHAGRKNSNSLG